MNKLKGNFSAIKMKYLIFVFAVAMLVALPTRVYQLLALVDTVNGFYNGNDFTVPVLYGVLFIFTVLFLVLSFLSKEVPSPKLPVGKNPVLGVASLIMVAGLGWDIFNIERKVVPQIEGGFSIEMFSTLFKSNLEQSGGWVLVLQFIFALLSIFYFLIFAVSHLNGKASYKEYKLLAVCPVCWATTVLISRLMTAVSFIKVSELLFEIFLFVFAMLFFITFARISSGVFTEDSMWGIYGYGFSAALFAGLVTIPRLVCAVAGLPYVDGYEFNFAHFALLIFVLSYIVASLGIGFKDGFKNIRTISEVELPGDDDVVMKYSKPSANASDVKITSSTAESVEEPEAVEETEESVEEPEAVEETEESVEEPEEVEETEESVEEPEEVEETEESDEEPEEVEETEESDEEPEEVEETAESVEEPEEVEEIEEADEETEEVEEKLVKAKNFGKGLFGLKKSSDKKPEDVAEDLKPISLADMRKNQK